MSKVLVPSTEYGPISGDENNNKQEAGLPKRSLLPQMTTVLMFLALGRSHPLHPPKTPLQSPMANVH